jgi:hypothetical protein
MDMRQYPLVISYITANLKTRSFNEELAHEMHQMLFEHGAFDAKLILCAQSFLVSDRNDKKDEAVYYVVFSYKHTKVCFRTYFKFSKRKFTTYLKERSEEARNLIMPKESALIRSLETTNSFKMLNKKQIALCVELINNVST